MPELIDSIALSTLLLDRVTRTIEDNRAEVAKFDQAVIDAGDDDEALAQVPLPVRHIALLFSDIDGTLKSSFGISADNLVPLEVRNSIQCINGLENCVFFIPATGRDFKRVDHLFAGLLLPTIANDGGEIRFPSGRTVRYDLPEIPEFLALGREIISRHEASDLQLDNAYGLSYKKDSKLFDSHLKQFRKLAEARPQQDVIIYEHEYVGTKEIIVQDSRHTKGTALEEIVGEFKVLGYSQFAIFTAGDSTNDESHFESALKLGGFSLRIGKADYESKARFYVKSISEYQEALIELARQLIRLRMAPSDSDGADDDEDDDTLLEE